MDMSSESHSFNVGDLKCFAISDGTFSYPHPSKNVFINFFANAPEDRLRETLESYNLVHEEWEEYVSPYTCLVIDDGKEQVLVDTGGGSIAPTTGNLIPNLKREGISPDDIDIVILTHAHPDHIGGCIDSEGNPSFPNARYIMCKDEHEFWTSLDLSELKEDDHGLEIIVNMAKNVLSAVRDQLELIECEAEIKPGISVVSAPGHTPGHVAVSIESRDAQLLFVSDTILHPIHLDQPGWHSSVAISPERVLASRHKIFNKAVSEKALVMVTHFPFPGLGYIVGKGEGWQWEPI